MSRTNKAKQLEVKLKELSHWEQELVYEEIDDEGQECISLWWVLKEKIDDNGLKPAYVPEDLRKNKISEQTARHLPEKDFARSVALYPQITGSSIR